MCSRIHKQAYICQTQLKVSLKHILYLLPPPVLSFSFSAGHFQTLGKSYIAFQSRCSVHFLCPLFVSICSCLTITKAVLEYQMWRGLYLIQLITAILFSNKAFPFICTPCNSYKNIFLHSTVRSPKGQNKFILSLECRVN